MLLYLVIPKIETENEDPIKVCTSQKEAYDFLSQKDPERTLKLQIYPVEA